MAFFKSPSAPRVIQLSINEDGSWRVITDLTPAEVRDKVADALESISQYAARVESGEPEADEDADNGE